MSNKKHIKRIIKLTESQMNEVAGDAYEYFKGEDDPRFDWDITATGKLNIGKFGDPLANDTDNIAKKVSPQGYNRYGTMYMHNVNQKLVYDPSEHSMEYGVRYDDDKPVRLTLGEQEHYQDAFDDKEASRGDDNVNKSLNRVANIDTLTDKDTKNDLEQIPPTINKLLDRLISAIKGTNLMPYKKAIIADKFIESINLGDNAYSRLKALSQEISAKQGV